MTRVFKLPMDVRELEEVIPHREPFRFLDEIVVFEDRVRAAGTYKVKGTEDFFRGHFPGRPIFPGVLLLESLAQLGVFFARYSTGGCPPEKLIVFMGADDVRFKKPVFPGDTLLVAMNSWKRKARFWRLEGDIHVAGEIVMSATISAAEID